MAFNPRGMICRQQLICFTPCEYKIRQILPHPMLFLLHGGKWRSDGCNLLSVPSAPSLYAVPTFMSCKFRPTYLRTYRWKDYRTDRARDGWTTGWPSCLHTGRLSYLIIYYEPCTLCMHGKQSSLRQHCQP